MKTLQIYLSRQNIFKETDQSKIIKKKFNWSIQCAQCNDCAKNNDFYHLCLNFIADSRHCMSDVSNTMPQFKLNIHFNLDNVVLEKGAFHLVSFSIYLEPLWLDSLMIFLHTLLNITMFKFKCVLWNEKFNFIYIADEQISFQINKWLNPNEIYTF